MGITSNVKRTGALAVGAMVVAASLAFTAGPAVAQGTAKSAPRGTVTAVKVQGSLPSNLKSLRQSGGTATHGVVPLHVGNYPTYWWDSYKWGANVQVDWGRDRAWTQCSNGWVYYGAWVGQGYWAFGGNCAPYGATLVDFGVQDG